MIRHLKILNPTHEQDCIIKVLARWASRTRDINRLYLFGSIARLEQHSRSDIDIAIESTLTFNPEKSKFWWFDRSSAIREELLKDFRSIGLDRTLHIECLDEETPKLQDYIKHGGILVFERN
jgi:predicted nucleotidyltransferase